MTGRPLRVGFMMDQIAGHVTNYRNLRKIVDADPSIDATWCEIEFNKPNGRIERVARSLRHAPPYVTGVARGALELGRGLRSADFDVIYTNSSVAVFYARRLAHTPTLLHLDSTPIQIDRMPSYPSPTDSAPIVALKKRLSTRLFNSVKEIHAWSTWAQQSFIGDYGVSADRVNVNPPGIDVEAWRRPADWIRPAGPPRVLFVGGDFQRKGGELLLHWFHSQAPGSVEVGLVTKEAVTPEPGVNVHRDKLPNTPELLRLFHDADIFALPSLGECFGIATVEAMAAGLPVVASDAGGTADIIESGRNGFIVEAGQQASLNRTMNTLVSDSVLCRAFGHVSTQLATTRFDAGVTAARTINAMKALYRESPTNTRFSHTEPRNSIAGSTRERGGGVF